MPTDTQLRAYVEALPSIYREILAAFPRLEPGRRQGYGLAFQTLAADFENRGRRFDLEQIMQACGELEDKGLIEVRNGIFARPTELGERLIGLVTGQQAPTLKVEPLPALPE